MNNHNDDFVIVFEPIQIENLYYFHNYLQKFVSNYNKLVIFDIISDNILSF
jgi:hypothetical protein